MDNEDHHHHHHERRKPPARRQVSAPQVVANTGGEEFANADGASGDYNERPITDRHLDEADDDSVQLILWYHSSHSSMRPIYSLDARLNQQQQQQQHHLAAAPSSSPGDHQATAADAFVPVPVAQLSQRQRANSIKHSGARLNYQDNRDAPAQNSTTAQVPSGGHGSAPAGRWPQRLVANVISGEAKRFVAARLSSRIHLTISSREAKAYLIIDHVEASDAGQYKCRVDFKYARTRYQLSQLDVITPITQLQISSTDRRLGADLWTGSKAVANETLPQQHSGGAKSSNLSDVNNHQQLVLPLVELSEDETLHLECRAKDGWPDAKLAWWHIHWPTHSGSSGSQPLAEESRTSHAANRRPALLAEAQVTQLSSQVGRSLAKVGASVGLYRAAAAAEADRRRSGADAQPAAPDAQPPVDLINAPANTKAATKQTNNTTHVSRRLSATTAVAGALGEANKSQVAGLYSNGSRRVNVAATTAAADEQWFTWMAAELEEALAAGGDTNWRPAALAAAAGKALLTRQLAATIDNNHQQLKSWRESQVNWAPLLSSSLTKSSGQQQQQEETSGASLTSAEMLHFVRQNQLQLYVCGGSNTRGNNNKLLPEAIDGNEVDDNSTADDNDQDQEDSSDDDQDDDGYVGGEAVNSLRDKLASIRPLFRSVLVQPVVRPSKIQMFLVGRKASSQSTGASSGDPKSEHLELTPLNHGQDLHLNLAAEGLITDYPSGEHQLQFLCLALGSLPAAKVEWFKREPLTDISRDEASQSNYLPLASENPSVTQSLVRALTSSTLSSSLSSSSSSTASFSWPANSTIDLKADLLNVYSKQWSSLRLHNIGIEDHEALIKCAAHNERLPIATTGEPGRYSFSVSSNVEHLKPVKLSTYVRLNITHVPLVKLELDSRNVSSSDTAMKTQFEETSPGTGSRNNNNINNLYNHRHYFHHRQYNHHHHDLKQIKPIIWGNNITLLCNVSFANPSLSEPIEWSVVSITSSGGGDSSSSSGSDVDVEGNGTGNNNNNNDDNNNNNNSNSNSGGEELLDKATHLVRVLARIQTSNRYHFIEKLIVQFNDESQLLHEIQLNCKARNMLGQAVSNTVRVVTGQLPHCQGDNQQDNSNSNSNNSNNDMMTDKDSSYAHCPVISDKGSSTFHWLVEPSQETTMSTSATIPLSSLNLPLAKLTTTSSTSTGNTNTSTTTAATSKIKEFNNSGLVVVTAKDSSTVMTSSDEVGLKISCYASDKFGSNDINPCLIRFGSKGGNEKEKVAVVGDAIPRAAHNCAANVVQKPPPNLRPDNDINLDNQAAAAANKQSTLLYHQHHPPKPKLLLTIECKGNQIVRSSGIGNGSGGSGGELNEVNDEAAETELIHLDLYQKRDTQFIKHLTSYPKEDGANVSLELELGQELETLPLGDIEEQHVIVMSVTDVNNRLKQPNITLFFNTTPSLNLPNTATTTTNQHDLQTSASINTKSSVDNLPRTNDSGHQDRLWVISSMSVVFMSSIMLVLLAWLCKSSHGSMGIGKTQGLDFNGNNVNGNHQQQQQQQQQQYNHKESNNHFEDHQLAEMQTEMYLVGEEPRLTVYHNTATNNKPLLSSCKDNQWKSGLRTSSTRETTTIMNPYDFRIIDPTTTPTTSPFGDTTTGGVASTTSSTTASATATTTKQQAILLLDPEIHTCSAYNHQGRGIQEQEQRCRPLLAATCATDVEGVDDLYQQQRFHIEPLIRLHPVSVDANDAILRAICNEQNSDVVGSHHLHLIDSMSSYPTLERQASRPSSQMGFFELHPAQKPRLIRTPIDQFVKTTTTTPITTTATTTTTATAAPNGYNFELNSQGELTMTDESSSFIHDDGHGNLEQTTMLICSQCRMDAQSSASIYHQSCAASGMADEFQLESQHSTPVDNMLNAAALSCLQHSSLLQSPASSSQSTSTARQETNHFSATSTLKRSTMASNSKRNERVRFVVDHQASESNISRHEHDY